MGSLILFSCSFILFWVYNIYKTGSHTIFPQKIGFLTSTCFFRQYFEGIFFPWVKWVLPFSLLWSEVICLMRLAIISLKIAILISWLLNPAAIIDQFLTRTSVFQCRDHTGSSQSSKVTLLSSIPWSISMSVPTTKVLTQRKVYVKGCLT